MAPGKRSVSAEESKASTKRSAGELPDIGSPLKRVKAAIRERKIAKSVREVVNLTTVEAFRNYVMLEANPPNPDIDVIITGTLIWKSQHKYGERDLVRLHLTDKDPAESATELQELDDLYNSSDENRGLVEGVLLTATVFGETLNSTNLPANGSVVCINRSHRRTAYLGEKCQLIARATDIDTMPAIA